MKLKYALVEAPVVIALSVNNKYMHSYKSGVIDALDCDDEHIYEGENINPVNHAVLAVGYGYNKFLGDYFLIKNSWSTTWGE